MKRLRSPWFYSLCAALLLADQADQLLLGDGPAQAAQGAFDLPQVTDFLAQLHIAICNINISFCDSCQAMDYICFQRDAAADSAVRSSAAQLSASGRDV